MSRINARWSWFLRLVIAMGGSEIAISTNFAIAQITPDTTLPSNSIVNPVGSTSVIEGGTQAGGNLFHSFQKFSIPTGNTVWFNNVQDIQNIISRVTGGSISNIDGLIRANGEANLFLLNPSGIIFGPNARVDIGGSFVGSTASSMKFADNTQFSATAPQTTPLLTISVPLGLQFGSTVGSIVNRSRATNSSDGIGLQVKPGKTLALVGGNVNLEGATMLAPGGRVELGAAASSETVGLTVDGNNLSLSFPSSVKRADIALTDGSFVGVAAGGGGSIAINARNIDVVGGSYLFAGIESSGDVVAGDITLNATEKIVVKQSSNIINEVSRGAIGNSGNINIDAESLYLENAFLSASTFGKGNGGSVKIDAPGTVTVDRNSQVLNFVEGEGNSGGISINTGSLTVANSSVLNSSTYGKGNGGSVKINAPGTVTVDRNSLVLSLVAGEGNSGGISIDTGSLTIANSSLFGSSITSGGIGRAGNITIKVRDTVSFNGYLVGAVSEVLPGGVGDGGNINITTGTLSLSQGALLVARTYGQGKGGSINVEADQLTLSSSASIQGDLDFINGRAGDINLNVTGQILLTGNEAPEESTRITLGVLPQGVGSAGKLTIHAGSLVIEGGGFIKNSSQAQNGSGGDIEVNADLVKISGTGSNSGLSSGLFTSTVGRKNAGNITIKTDTFYIADGAALSARTTGDGQGGNITVNANKSFEAVNGGQIVTTTSGNGNAGSILVDAKERVTISGTDLNYDNRIAKFRKPVNPSIANNIEEGSASALIANAEINSTGAAGNLTINTVSAYTAVEAGAEGNGGDIEIKAGSLSLINGGQVNAFVRGASDNEPTKVGNAGSTIIKVNDAFTISGFADKFSGVFNDLGSGATGRAGNIDISTGLLSMMGDARLNASTSGNGNAGNINIEAKRVSLSSNASIQSQSESVGRAGNIAITSSGTLSANDSRVTTSALQSSGGAIDIKAANIRLFGNSDITTNVESGAGDGGNITLTANSIIAFGDSDILAFARDGQGGKISLNTPAFFGQNYKAAPRGIEPSTLDGNNRVDINASGAVSGVITLPDTSFIQNSLSELPENVIDTGSLIANSCIARANNQQQGTFIITGSGALPSRPGDALMSKYTFGSVRTNNVSVNSNRRPWQKGDPIIEPQGAYRLPSGRLVLSRECS